MQPSEDLINRNKESEDNLGGNGRRGAE
jgi:hypothetical protein